MDGDEMRWMDGWMDGGDEPQRGGGVGVAGAETLMGEEAERFADSPRATCSRSPGQRRRFPLPPHARRGRCRLMRRGRVREVCTPISRTVAMEMEMTGRMKCQRKDGDWCS
ncbi:hypothetical protein R5R35_001849 [Gryllus longicercus]|uniref:Uncharacterized protein n=1 Tax=Gryllus longicercus TaxID=2509291 RepID=A0AAN9V8F7_9ORTH